MKTIRRLYLYGIAFVSLEVIIWGTIGLLRGFFSQTLSGPEALLRALALVIVGMPVFLIHWLWGKRLATQDAEEAASLIRAVFFYATLLANGIPIAQNLLALFNRALLRLFKVSSSYAMLGGRQTPADNLIAIFVLAIFSAYFYQQLRLAWKSLDEVQNFKDARRIYRFAWVLYGLLLLVTGSIQMLRFVFYWPAFWGGDFRFRALNGLAFAIVGLPIWYYAWGKSQEDADTPSERESIFRLGIYAFLTIGSALVVLVANILLLYTILELALHISSWHGIEKIGDAISILIPFLVVWGFYRRWFHRQLENAPADRAQEVRRFSLAVLALAGLIAFAVGAGTLLNLLAATLTTFGSAEALRRTLVNGLSALAVGVPYWLIHWIPLEREMPEKAEMGGAAHRSLVRRAYLYLVLFGSVLAVMGFAITLVYQALRLLLLAQQGNTLTTLLSSAFLVVFFSTLLIYHLQYVRREAAWSETLQRSRFAGFRILLLAEEEAFAQPLEHALVQAMPGVQIARLAFSSPPPEGGDLLIYPLTPPFSLPTWVHTFPATHLMLPLPAADKRLWVSLLHRRWPEQAAKMARQIALGEELRQPFQVPTIWTILGYLFAISFAFQLLALLATIAIALVSD
ncbi:MAG: DUF5671 domain-containing protein [Anaerolineales bacterium]